MKFETGKTYTSRSAYDRDCIFEIKVTKRTDKSITYLYEGRLRRSVIRVNENGDEYIRSDNYSFAPIFRA
jgi:hypothetical protein